MGFLGQLRLAVRILAKNRAQTALAILILAAGIGANTAVFSVFKAVVLDPFPYPDADRIVEVWSRQGTNWWRQPQSSPNYLDIKRESTSFEELGAYNTRVYNVSDRALTAVQGVAATSGVLRTFGVAPALGRLFTEAEEQGGNQRVVVLSHGLWKRLWAADPQVVGRTIRINGENHEVIGVMPESFEFHSPWFRGSPFELWTPLVVPANRYRGSYWLLSVGRLKEGVDRRTAEAELESIASRLGAQYPDTNSGTHFWIVPLKEEILGGVVGRLVLLLLTVGLVLLMACANVAAILLARGAGRQTEVAIRVSLGASPGRIVAQFLAESLVLSLAGGVAGVLLALWGLDALRKLMPPTMPRAESIGLDSGVLLFTFIASVVTAILSGLAPARTAARIDVVEALKEGGGSRVATRDRNRALRIIAAVQLALALVLMNGAILLYSSYRNLVKTDLDFDTAQVLAVEMWLAGPKFAAPEDRIRFAERLRETVSGLPGVERAEVTTKLPLEGGRNGEVLTEEQAYERQADRPLAEWSYVSSGYFRALGIPLLSGRTLQRLDENPAEYGVVVNRALVQACWPDGNALGKRLRMNAAEPRWRAIVVGIVENVRQHGAERRALPEIYFPYAAEPREKSILVVRSRSAPRQLIPAVQKQVATLEPDLALARTRTMDSVFAEATRHRRFITLLLDLFSAIALILAVAGIYGTLSYQVAQRTHEFGVRLALGARQSDVLGLVLRQTLGFVVPGLAVGLVATINAAFLLRSLLYGVSPLDPTVLSGGVLLVAAAAFLASLVPAFRACRVNPIRALRTE